MRGEYGVGMGWGWKDWRLSVRGLLKRVASRSVEFRCCEIWDRGCVIYRLLRPK